MSRAIEKVRRDDAGISSLRPDVEPVLERLIEEFRVELATLGVRPLTGVTQRPALAFTPVSRAQLGAGFASRDISLLNSQGRDLEHGVNGNLTFESRAHVGDVLSFYLQPDLLGNAAPAPAFRGPRNAA